MFLLKLKKALKISLILPQVIVNCNLKLMVKKDKENNQVLLLKFLSSVQLLDPKESNSIGKEENSEMKLYLKLLMAQWQLLKSYIHMVLLVQLILILLSVLKLTILLVTKSIIAKMLKIYKKDYLLTGLLSLNLKTLTLSVMIPPKKCSKLW